MQQELAQLQIRGSGSRSVWRGSPAAGSPAAPRFPVDRRTKSPWEDEELGGFGLGLHVLACLVRAGRRVTSIREGFH